MESNELRRASGVRVGAFAIGLLWSSLAGADDLDVTIHEIHPVGDPVLQVIAEVSQKGTELPADDVTSEEIEEGFSIQGADIGDSAEASRFEDSGQSFGTVILIDGSHSMEKEKPAVKRAVKGFIDGMGENDLAMIAIFNQPISPTKEPVVYGLDTGWTSNQAQLRSHLEDLMERESFRHKYTHLNQALNETITHIDEDSDSPVMRGILLLSDGADDVLPKNQRDYDQTYPPSLAKDRAIEKHVRISSVFYKSDPKEHRRGVLKTLSDATDGSMADADDSGQIRQRFKEAQDRIHSLWVIHVRTGELVASQNYNAELEVREDSRDLLKFNVADKWEGDSELKSTKTVMMEDTEKAIEEASDKSNKTMLLILAGVGVGLVGLIVVIGRSQSKKRQVAEDVASEARMEALAAQDAARAAANQARAAEERAQQAQVEAEALAQSRAEAPSPRTAQVTTAGPPASGGRTRKTMFAPPAETGSESGLLLTVLEGGEANSQIDVFASSSNPVVRVGSDSDRVDLILQHQTVSGHHCNISRDAQQRVTVEDMGSSNGTWIDGQDIRGMGPVLLSPGQQLHFGLLKTWYTS